MTEAEIKAFADMIHDVAIQYANGHETDFRPVAHRIAEASRSAALEEAAKLVNPYDDEGTLGARTADAIRALSQKDPQ